MEELDEQNLALAGLESNPLQDVKSELLAVLDEVKEHYLPLRKRV